MVTAEDIANSVLREIKRLVSGSKKITVYYSQKAELEYKSLIQIIDRLTIRNTARSIKVIGRSTLEEGEIRIFDGENLKEVYRIKGEQYKEFWSKMLLELSRL